MLLCGALVACGDCNRGSRPGPDSEPSVLSLPAPAACAIANPQLPKSNAAANVTVVAFNIAYPPLAPPSRGLNGNVGRHRLVPGACASVACGAGKACSREGEIRRADRQQSFCQ